MQQRERRQQQTTWKVGELARQSGLTVRTLHHYDTLKLLSPSLRSDAGHRLYTARDVARLQQIRSLRALGFSLEEVRQLMERAHFSPREVVQRHAAHLRRQVEAQLRLVTRLELLAEALERTEESAETWPLAGTDTPAALLLTVLDEMSMVEKYFTQEQSEAIRLRGETVGAERIRAVEQEEWPRLMAEVQAAMDAGVPPSDPAVRALAERWMGLVAEFTGGDTGIRDGVSRMWQEETEIHGIQTGPMRAMMDYITQALAIH